MSFVISLIIFIALIWSVTGSIWAPIILLAVACAAAVFVQVLSPGSKEAKKPEAPPPDIIEVRAKIRIHADTPEGTP